MKGNLLIIDDEKYLTENLEMIFAKHADRVFTANSGAEGLKVLNENSIHSVICDIFMPGLSGIDVITQVRENGNNVPFIFFTAYGADELKEKIATFENTLFLTKPDIASIVHIIEKMLSLGMASEVQE